jgi:hypothetical protein
VGVEAADRLLQSGAVDIGDDGDVVAAGMAAERVDEQLGAERRAADADVQDVADRSERLGLDRVDEGAHAGVEAAGAGDALGRPLPALGAMLGGAPFGRVDDLAGKERVAVRGEAGGVGEGDQGVERLPVKMGLGEIEADAGFLDDEARQAIGLGGEEIGEGRGRQAFEGRPGSVGRIAHAEGI